MKIYTQLTIGLIGESGDSMAEPIDDELTALRKKRLQELSWIDDKSLENPPDRSFPQAPIHITDGTIQNFVKEYPIVVIDCWAEWCGPCRTLGPIIDALAKELQGKVVFGKLNVDQNQRTATMYQTMSIPTLLVFKDGKPIDRIVGALPKPMLMKKIQSYLPLGE